MRLGLPILWYQDIIGARRRESEPQEALSQILSSLLEAKPCSDQEEPFFPFVFSPGTIRQPEEHCALPIFQVWKKNADSTSG